MTTEAMHSQRINAISAKIITVLSVAALFTLMIGYTRPPLPDEGALAHIFQLSIVVLAPMVVVFTATADWKQPLRNINLLRVPAVALILAFAALYYLEHYW